MLCLLIILLYVFRPGGFLEMSIPRDLLAVMTKYADLFAWTAHVICVNRSYHDMWETDVNYFGQGPILRLRQEPYWCMNWRGINNYGTDARTCTGTPIYPCRKGRRSNKISYLPACYAWSSIELVKNVHFCAKT